MKPRVRKTAIGNVLFLGSLFAVGFVFMDGPERTTWFLLWVPLTVLISVLMDFFVWNSPKRERRRRQGRDRPRYGG